MVGGIIIRNITIEVADEKYLEFVDGLRNLGINRNMSKLITYLKDVEESSSRDIEMATGLRQPEVSIAMQPLRELGWISERDVKNSGKSRPQKIYALRVTIDEIIEHYEAKKNNESAQTMWAIQRLKELSSTLVFNCSSPRLRYFLNSEISSIKTITPTTPGPPNNTAAWTTSISRMPHKTKRHRSLASFSIAAHFPSSGSLPRAPMQHFCYAVLIRTASERKRKVIYSYRLANLPLI
jgi:predicted transcriptional regulator